jgi:hypothetical protein
MAFSRHPGPLPIFCRVITARDRRVDIVSLDALADVLPPTLAPT